MGAAATAGKMDTCYLLIVRRFLEVANVSTNVLVRYHCCTEVRRGSHNLLKNYLKLLCYCVTTLNVFERADVRQVLL